MQGEFKRDNVPELNEPRFYRLASAAWSIPFAQADGGTKVTAVDFESVTKIARHLWY